MKAVFHLKDIDDHAICLAQLFYWLTICLEGVYKVYVRKHVAAKSELSDFMQLCTVVKDDITENSLKVRGPFPEHIVNAIPTLTNAVANSRNGFSESHFADDAHKRLALFARDITNSIGQLLLENGGEILPILYKKSVKIFQN